MVGTFTFITLTSAGTEDFIVINLAKIVSFTDHMSGTAIICDGSYHIVNEPMDEIQSRLEKTSNIKMI